MNPNIAVALISAAGVILSALISWFVSRGAAKRELEKTKLTWEREDVVSSDEEFAEMAAAVSSYLHSCAPNTKAISLLASLRSKETGTLAELLDKLYYDICEERTCGSVLDRELSEVIQEKRKRKGPTK